jgi:hypothetical protein
MREEKLRDFRRKLGFGLIIANTIGFMYYLFGGKERYEKRFAIKRYQETPYLNYPLSLFGPNYGISEDSSDLKVLLFIMQ